MKRAFGFLLAFVLLTGGAAACSDDDGDDAATEVDAGDTGGDTSGDGGDGGDDGDDDGGETTDSGNADVVAYCDAVDEYVSKVEDAMGDPAAAAALTEESQELSETAAALATAGLSAEEAEEVADCTERATSALTDSVN